MPHMAIYDMAGVKTRDIDVPDDVLGLSYNPDLIHQAVVAVDWARKRKCGRAKTRGEVSLSTVKMYRQKGLGRARHGAKSAPIFVGGGKAHGPTGEQRSFSMPKRMRRKAVYVALSQRARQHDLVIVDEFKLEAISTQRFVQALADLKVGGKVLLLLGTQEAQDEVLYKSARNIEGLIAREIPHFNTRDVLWAQKVLVTEAALEQLMGGGEDNAEL